VRTRPRRVGVVDPVPPDTAAAAVHRRAGLSVERWVASCQLSGLGCQLSVGLSVEQPRGCDVLVSSREPAHAHLVPSSHWGRLGLCWQQQLLLVGQLRTAVPLPQRCRCRCWCWCCPRAPEEAFLPERGVLVSLPPSAAAGRPPARTHAHTGAVTIAPRSSGDGWRPRPHSASRQRVSPCPVHRQGSTESRRLTEASACAARSAAGDRAPCLKLRLGRAYARVTAQPRPTV
jgi:hypothetical protein